MNIEELPKIIEDMQSRISKLEARLHEKPKPTYVGYKGAAEITGLKVSTLRWKVSQGELTPQKYSGRSPLFHVEYLRMKSEGATDKEAILSLVKRGELITRNLR
ncbi:MAG: hypothetical protein J5I94_09325 [Phaeodactylibacter sp.]|nr:hypothetical protein [Phaeodactylibacter sp.]